MSDDRGRDLSVPPGLPPDVPIFETVFPTRWPDFDSHGHLNHAVYHVCLGAARDDVLRSTVGGYESWPSVLAHVAIDYLREIRIGASEVIIRSAVVRVGQSSVKMAHELRLPDEDLAATATSVVVAWDRATRQRRILTCEELEALSRPHHPDA